MVAVHLMQLKLAAQALKNSWAEPRTYAIAGKLARTYAAQLETMGRLKGKGSRQRITVRKFSQHEHKHIHLPPGGLETGNQAYGPTTEGPDQTKAIVQIAERAALPCSNSAKNALPVPGSEGPETMQVARGRKRNRCSHRR